METKTLAPTTEERPAEKNGNIHVHSRTKTREIEIS